MRNWMILFLLPLFAVLFASEAGVAVNSGQCILLYELQPGASFQQGCFPPCACPVMASDTLQGTFGLMAGGPGPIPLDVSKFDVYSLTDISWTVFDSTGKQVHTITGKGTYQLEKVAKGMARRQELTLDISIDGQSPVTLDSGLVLGCSQFPDIVISVRRGSTCFETTMDIAAAPGN